MNKMMKLKVNYSMLFLQWSETSNYVWHLVVLPEDCTENENKYTHGWL